MSGLTVQPLSLAGLCLVTRHGRDDDRGSFVRLWSAEDLSSYGFPAGPVQVNHSITVRRGTVRGLHYQRPPCTETRLVSCIRGAIFDVAVDIRHDSPTYLQWHAERLSRENGRALLIPEGFAHGFQALTDDCEIIYCHSQPYAPDVEAGIPFDDPALAISWPLPVTLVSSRDRAHPRIGPPTPRTALGPRCRHCGGELTRLLVDLGPQPFSNDLLRADRIAAPETVLPLRAFVCDGCWLVQTEDVTSREILFNRDYPYFSSTSSTWVDHAAAYATMIVRRLGLTNRHFVLEIASNDGCLLRNFVAHGIPCLGVEPTASTAAAAVKAGVPTRRDFFGEDVARSLAAEGTVADLVVANNVLAHVPDINDFARGLATVLAPHGTVTLEFPSLRMLLERTLFDTIYHEHFSYLSLATAGRILRAAGLRVFDVEDVPTHGGSLRVYACHDRDDRPADPRVSAMLAAEVAAGLEHPSAYEFFQERAERIRDALRCFLAAERAAGRRVAGYGAAAKGNTLLNFAGITPDLLPYVCDAAASKQGLFLPGSRIPILAPDHLVVDRPDTVLILPWNLADEIKEQLGGRLPATTRYVVAIPRMADV